VTGGSAELPGSSRRAAARIVAGPGSGLMAFLLGPFRPASSAG